MTMTETSPAIKPGEQTACSTTKPAKESRIRYGLTAALLFCAYTFIVLDRANVNIVALDLKNRIGLTDELYGIGVAAFFISYLPAHIANPMLSLRFGGGRWIGILTALTGLITATTSLANTPSQYIFFRFLLGAVEGGAWPTLVLYVSAVVPAKERGKLLSVLLMSVPLMGAFGSIVSGHLLQMSGLGIFGWQWVFLAEGIPAILIGSLVILTSLKPEHVTPSPTPSHVELGLPKLNEKYIIILLSIISIGFTAGGYVVQFWSAKILIVSGANLKSIGLLSGIPHFAGFVTLGLWYLFSRKFTPDFRALTVPLLMASVAIGIAAVVVPDLFRTLFWLTVSTAALYVVVPTFWHFVPSLIVGRNRAAWTGAITAIGTLPGIIIPPIFGFLGRNGTGYSLSLSVSALFPLVAVFASLLLAAYAHRRIDAICD
jgi:MFS transporter, ACS family, tartrate transporter